MLLPSTTAGYSNLTSSAPRVATPNVSATDTIEVSVDVTNHSPIAGTTVVQLYFQQMQGGAAVIRYYCQLVGFARTYIGASTAVTVKIPLKIADLAYWDNDVREHAALPQLSWFPSYHIFVLSVLYPSVDLRSSDRCFGSTLIYAWTVRTYGMQEEGFLGAKGWRLGRPGMRTTYNLMAGLQAPECSGSASCDLPGVQVSFDVPPLA